MKILVIGGSGFLGRPLVHQLARIGHDVTVLHRGRRDFDLPARSLIASRVDLPRLHPRADVVVDLILSSGRQARESMDALRGYVGRVVAASSMDVYRAAGILHGTEDGPADPPPLTEDSPLRSRLHPYPREQIRALQSIFGWLDEEYDKIPVERAVLGDDELPGTVLRLPMVYGPGDRLRRHYSLLRRMSDGRRKIPIEERWAAWRAPRGYVENVAAALALAAVSSVGAGRIYNVAERPAYSEQQWATMLATAAKWDGEFVILPERQMPPHLHRSGNPAQDWDADSSRIRRELGYVEPIALADALRRTVEWELANPPAEFDPLQFDYAAEDAAFAACSA